jgi:two-component system alkaline phosphatase synthesis response regulator PhoP
MMKRRVKFNGQSNGDAIGGPSASIASVNRDAVEQSAGPKTRILIVEDEPAMVAGLRDNFEYEGYEVISAADGAEGLERALADSPDLVVLDVMMPRLSGLDVCKQLKTQRPSLPIIMLTARGQEIDKVVGLELGADDYVTKPFSIRELMARVKAVLRRVSVHAPAAEVYRFSDVEVNVRSNEVLRAGAAVDLSAKEFALLAYFVAHPAETLTRDRLLDAVWGYENYPNTRTVDTHIVHLRQKLEPNPEEPRFILTVHGSGYKFVG